MARKVTIDVEARFIDNVTGEAKDAAQSFEDLEKAAEGAQKDIDKLGKTTAKPKVDVDTSRTKEKLKDIDDKLNKLGKSKTEAKLSLLDRATAVIEKVKSKAAAFGSKTYSALVKIRDSNVLSTINKMSSGITSLTKKAWTVAVKIKDTFTAPITKLKNMLFNVKTLIAGIATAWAATKLVVAPINAADAYSSAKISFSTLLGATQGQQMMDSLDEFAKKTPFNTSNVIANAQKMLAMNWDPTRIIEDMETLGNAAAATGKLDQGLEQIVRAMAQIKTKGKLSTEELNQLAEAGIAAKAMLAEELGFGTGDAAIAAMTEVLEDKNQGIASDEAIEALLRGMKKYDGMMDSMANETVEGLISQLGDAFDINIVRRWGQGLQEGAKRGMGTLVSLLDEAEAALAKVGDMLYELGKKASNWAADKLQGVVDKISEITGSFEFENASLGEKFSMLWKGLVSDPLAEWWENGGREKTAETAGKIGAFMGKMLTGGLLAIFGATEVLNNKAGADAGSNIAGSFVEGFLENFDGKAITDAFVDAISNIWEALPWWGKMLIGGYGVGTLAGGISRFAGGIVSFAGGLKNIIGSSAAGTGLLGAIGSFSIASSQFPILTSSGTGIAGLLGKAGVSLGASTAGSALLMGSAGAAGGIIGGVSLIKGGLDLYNAYKYNKEGNELESKANLASGGTTIGGVAAGAAAGAAIGSVVPILGTALGALIGAGIGGVAGWIGGEAWGDSIRATDDAINNVTAATQDLESEQEKLDMQNKMVWQNMKDHFGDIKLTMSEISRIAEHTVWGENIQYYEQFTAAVQGAADSLTTLKTSSEATRKWMWKASVGIKFTEKDAEAIVASFDDYISSAIAYAENKHYEFSAAVSLILDADNPGTVTSGGMMRQSILKNSNKFYSQLQGELSELSNELTAKVSEALADGVISTEPIMLQNGTIQLSEADEIASLQQQIADILQKISDAEAEAELELIKMKFDANNIDSESFDALIQQMNSTIETRMAANDEAFKVAVSGLRLQLNEGAITETEYQKQLAALIEGYEAKVDAIKVQVLNVELGILADAYEQELGPDAVSKLNNALNQAMKFGIDPITWTPDQVRQLLGIPELTEDSALAIAQYLSDLAAQMDLININGDLMHKIKESVGAAIPESLDEQISINLTAFSKIMNNVNILAEEFGIKDAYAKEILWKLSGTKGVENKLYLLCTEFGIEPVKAQEILWKLSGIKSVSPMDLFASDFGIRSSYTFNPLININGQVGNVTLPTTQFYGKHGRYRGGIVGGTSAQDSFARGGIIDGSTRFIRVNEESPEMIIPLSDQRRGRALKLWAQAGNIMGVPGFARGGIVGGTGGSDEGIRFNTYSSKSESAGGRTVHVDVGGVTLEINVNGSNKESIVEAIKAQAGELADYFVGIIAESLEAEFENTPLRGDVA